MKKRMNKLIVIRRSSQTAFLALFVYILWSTTYPLKGLLPAETFFAADPHIMLLISVSERIILPGLYIALPMIFLTLLLGRFFCGWVCPLGTFIDLAGVLRRRKNTRNDGTARIVRTPKFFILGAGLIAALAGMQIAWIFDPIVIAARFVSLNFIPTATLLIERIFILLIRDLKLNEPFYPIYQSLQMSLLGVKVSYFDSSLPIFVLFAAICLSSLFLSRAWCRSLCPLGAFYALTAAPALLSRKVTDCVHCGRCNSYCRTGAIRENMSYAKGECILCMDCVYNCPGGRTKFSFGAGKSGTKVISAERTNDKNGISRGQFLFIILLSFMTLAFRWRGGKGKADSGKNVIRPPASLNEKDFLERCVRCGNCMKVCPTNGLQPALLESGFEGIWTPRLVPEIGYCEYNCTLCGQVCPTRAIKKVTLAEKHATKLGTAQVDRSICIAWSKNQSCLVCEEHCPVSQKAIKADSTVTADNWVGKPVVVEELCVGCGICQTKCPVRPARAIKVSSEGAYRP